MPKQQFEDKEIISELNKTFPLLTTSSLLGVRTLRIPFDILCNLRKYQFFSYENNIIDKLLSYPKYGKNDSIKD